MSFFEISYPIINKEQTFCWPDILNEVRTKYLMLEENIEFELKRELTNLKAVPLSGVFGYQWPLYFSFRHSVSSFANWLTFFFGSLFTRKLRTMK